MSRARFVFEDLGAIEARLRCLTADAAYLVLQDRSEKGKDLRVGRFDLLEVDARPWLNRDPDDPHDSPEDPTPDIDPDDDHDDDDYDDDAAELVESESDDEADLTWPQILKAACLWLRDTAQRHSAGQSPRRLRLKILAPKGSSLIDSGHFTCRDRSYRKPMAEDPGAQDAHPAGLPPMPPMPEASIFNDGGEHDALGALGRYYTQFGHVVLGTVGQLQGINNTMVTRLASDLDRSRTQVEELVASILEYRASQLEQEHAHQAKSAEVDAKTMLARETIGTIGEAAKVLLGVPNLPPEVMGLVQLVGQNSQLVQTLTDPAVMALLSDPNNVAMIGGLLRKFAGQAQAMKQAQGGQAPPPPSVPGQGQGAAGATTGP